MYGLGFLQVYLGSSGARDKDGKELPRLVYVSREIRPCYQHNKKAGAMNALVSDSNLKFLLVNFSKRKILEKLFITPTVLCFLKSFEFLLCLPMHLSC